MNSNPFNIMDQPIPEINVPILKPQLHSLKQLAGKAASSVNKQINEIANWVLSWVPQVNKKLVNKRVEALKNEVNNIYNKIKSKTAKVQKKKSALKGFVSSYRLKGTVKTDSKTFLMKTANGMLSTF